MKRLFLLALILSFVISPVAGEYVDMTLSYPTTVEKGQEVRITFEIINQSNDMLWDGKITIDDSFMDKYKDYIISETEYQINPFKFSTVNAGKSYKETFVLKFKEDIPLNEAIFNIVLRCGKGPCRGGCAPFMLEKTVNIKFTEKRADAALTLEEKNFTAYRNSTLEIPFTLKNTGDIQIRHIEVEVKGDISSADIVRIPTLNPGTEISNKIIVSIDENISKTDLNPIVVLKFVDPDGRAGLIYENITIEVIENEKVEEFNNAKIDTKVINEEKPATHFYLYIFLFLSIVAVILVIIFLLYLFKR
ncbi:MAG: hypothetical protein APG12_00330 [Candidatus Methanofastidiosum methylothiophilum]|uniref:CARDB domain-containing protein n=1 Tax=Candidatus Methanofastidiosum methylothiophilum TaxID=1705564 RepID=A0A150ITZ1_9EURY|nr:MAG: hypothetical protein APG10_00174 [Candidatus Methanofastidiosum methylthiophilus]KYC48443.1 MAG: hypothetical protein APG11_00356 [Candidatus Methanofastidiosum methylthiophilus]KYC51045.1 MAG: hypothetical protein APG12_00330 [Candidatus Methanofastidiosum methylthiophilus]